MLQARSPRSKVGRGVVCLCTQQIDGKHTRLQQLITDGGLRWDALHAHMDAPNLTDRHAVNPTDVQVSRRHRDAAALPLTRGVILAVIVPCVAVGLSGGSSGISRRSGWEYANCAMLETILGCTLDIYPRRSIESIGLTEGAHAGTGGDGVDHTRES
jgi:hypothetical protein